MPFLELQLIEVKYTMNGPDGSQPGCKAKQLIPRSLGPRIHVKRIQTDTRAKKNYVGDGEEKYLQVLGIEGRTITVTGIFVDDKSVPLQYEHEGIIEFVGSRVAIADNAGGAIPELIVGKMYDIDSFAYVKTAVKRSSPEFTLVLSYVWKDGEAEASWDVM